MRLVGMLLAGALLPAIALAETPPTPRIAVAGSGSVFTPPDLAVIGYSVHGEGTSSDAAVTALVTQRDAIDRGVRTLVETPAKGGEIAIRQVRSRECDASSYGAPRLDTGACAVIGYVADLSLEIRTTRIDKAATTAGLIGRLGGRNPRVASYTLADPRPAQRRAMAAALADAKARAQAIAEGAGVRLGTILSASDGSRGDTPDEIIVTGARAEAPPPPPPPPPAPIAVEVRPRPIETTARANVTYQIAP